MAEQDLINFCDRFWLEGKRAQEQTDLVRADEYFELVRGRQWPEAMPRHYPAFMLNVLHDHVQRKTALLTDARPVMDVATRNPGLQDVADILRTLVQSLWDELSWQERLAKGIGFSMIAGANVATVVWDPTADQGLGELRPQFFDPRFCVLDPTIRSPLDIEHAEFMGTEELRPIASLVEQFGPRAEAVRPDSSSGIRGRSQATRPSLLSAATGVVRRFRRRPPAEGTAVPKAYVRHTWFKDWERDEHGQPRRYEQVTYANGVSRLKPRRRILRHVVTAGGVVLVDEPNPYWHGQYPYDILDWGLESEHPWGQSEIRQLQSAQMALNRLASQILRNASLLNNFRIVSDHDAMDPEQFDLLSNRPAIVIKKRRNRQITFEAPPALPSYLFTLIEFLLKAIDLVGGLNEVARGTGTSGMSGITVEALQVAAQSVVRLQARRIEAFLTRLFNKVIACIFQYYTSDRVRYLSGPDGQLIPYIFNRASLVLKMHDPRKEFRDFTLSTHPGSSLNATRIQRAVLEGNLFQMGLVGGLDVLKAVEHKDPEGTYERAKQEAAEKAQMAAAAGLRQAIPGGKRQLQSFPAGIYGENGA